MGQASRYTLVLLTIGCLDIGGAERRLLQLARYLRATRAPVRLAFFVISGRKGRLEDDFRDAGCEIYYGRPGIRGLVDLARMCRKLKPEILHANSETAAGFYCFAAKLARVPRTISHMRSSRANGDAGSIRGLIYERLTGLFSDVVIGVSESALADKHFGGVPQRVIYNGLDPAELVAAESSQPPLRFGGSGPDFVILGRLDRLKNIPHVVSAFRLFAQEHGDRAGRLHVVGPEGNISVEELKALAFDAGLSERVLFHGPTSEPLRFFFHADCALLASDYEGLPGAALEALSCGTPLVASDIPPSLEVMRLTTGVEVIPVSNLKGWADAMSRALELDKKTIRDHFWKRSPFSLVQHANEMMEVWGLATVRA